MHLSNSGVEVVDHKHLIWENGGDIHSQIRRCFVYLDGSFLLIYLSISLNTSGQNFVRRGVKKICEFMQIFRKEKATCLI